MRLGGGNTSARRLRGNLASGAVLVEFAVAMFVFSLVSLGGIELMRAYLTEEVLGEGARIAARESATKPGPLGTPLDPNVFNEIYTVIDLDNLLDPSGAPLTDQDGDSDVDVDDLFRILPPMHTALRSIMIRDNLAIPGRRLLRFPGSLFRDPGASLGRDLIVKIPHVVSEGATTDVELSKVVELDYNAVTNTVFSHARYHFQFATLPSASPVTGLRQKSIDQGTIVVTNPGELGTYTVPIQYDLKPPGGLSGKFRTLDIRMQQDSAARKEIP